MHEVSIRENMGCLLGHTIVPKPDDKPRVASGAVVIAVEVTPASNGGFELMLAGGAADRIQVQKHMMAGKISVTEFVTVLRAFTAALGVTVPQKKRKSRFYVVAYDMKAVLASLDSVFRDVFVEPLGDIHHGYFAVQVERTRWRVDLLDLTAFFVKAELDDVGELINFSEPAELVASLAGAMGADAPRSFVDETRNVKIAYRGFIEFREKLVSRFGVDPLVNRTVASLAARIFKLHYLKTGPQPWARLKVARNRPTKDGTFRTVARKEPWFDGNKEVRLAAARAMWGGRMEAMGRGVHVGQLAEVDAVSLYPYSALRQPLPHHRTPWFSVEQETPLDDVEGFVRVVFEFPVGFMYPSLPVARAGINRTLFPRTGDTWVTISEVCAARRLGADISVMEGWAFRPGERERAHDVAAYMQEMLKAKSAAKKGTITYEINKLLLNALVGKLMERRGGSSLLDFEREAQRNEFAPGLGAAVARSPALQKALKKPLEAGSCFAPEWASLILGRSRAIMADICASGALLVSTDAVIVRAGTRLDSPGLRALKELGSDMRVEHEVDGMFVNRNRSYVLLKEPENVSPRDTVYARDEQWAVVKVARHGSLETKEEFGETVLACMRAGRNVAPDRVRVRKRGVREAMVDGAEVNSEKPEPHRTTFNPDGKRRVVDRDGNIFRTYSPTAPYDSLSTMEAAERRSQVRRRRARRSRTYALQALDEVIALLRKGVGVREISRRTRVPVSTVSDMKAKAPHEVSHA